MVSVYRDSKRAALIVVTAVLIGVSLLCHAPKPAHAAPSNALLAVPAREWTQLFERSSGWIGADGIFSIPLNGKDAIGSANSSTKTMCCGRK